jgi:MFS family permease
MTSNNSDDNDNYAIKFNLLYSLYSIPNIILPFFGGTIVDKIGAPYSALLFASLTLIGQIIFAIGAQTKNWNLMLFGRTFYGFGGESITVATSTLNSIWFEGQELALSFGINLAVSRMGSVLNNWISPSLANSVSTPFAIWFGVGMNLMSVMAIFGIIWLSVLGERQCNSSTSYTTNIENNAGATNTGNGIESLTAALLEDYEGQEDESDQIDGLHEKASVVVIPDCEHVESLKNADTVDVDVDEMIDTNAEHNTSNENELRHLFVDDENEEATREIDERSNVDEDGVKKSCPSFQFMDEIQKFNTLFWLLSISCVVVYGCVLPFNNIASGVLLERNYFTSPPKDCAVTFLDQCTTGSIAPRQGNPSKDINGDSCPVNSNSQPILPQSIHIESSSSDNGWDHNSYQFDNLTSNDVDCGDKFWSQACTQDYCDAQRRATETSGKIMSIPYFLSALLSPLCGHIIDKVGSRAIIACFASIMLIAVHLALALSVSSPVLPLIGQGLAYTFYASVIWPSVPLTVKEESVGTAFGTITAIQNIGLAIFPLIIAAIYTASDEMYIPNVEFFFVGCAITGTMVGVLLNVFDKRHGGMLNRVKRREVVI